MNVGIEIQKERLAKHHYVEHVSIGGTGDNQKLEVTPTDEFARQKLKQKNFEDYTVFIDIQ